jgi:hypothetical protein
VGEFFGKHFVAAHQQVGDFRVVEVNGELQKNGGNVASYFCTPEGRVIHAVTGPVAAEVLLAEAQWALDTLREMAEYPVRRQPAAAALAHYRELAGMVPQQEAAGRWNRKQFGSRESQVHELFARRPLPLLEEVYEQIFERVLGQRVSDSAPRQDTLERGLSLARETGKPVLFVLHKHHENGPFYDDWRRRMGPRLGDRAPLATLLKSYVMIVLPLEDLPAVSRVLDQPPFSAPSQETPLFVIADATGKQLDAAAGWEAHDELKQKLGVGLVAALRERTPPVSELRRIVRFLEKIDRKLAQEAVQLVPKAREEAAQRVSAVKPPADDPAWA